MKTNVQLGYALGAGSLLAAIVYFYASNWGVMGRFAKLFPVFVLIAALYGASVWLARRPGRQFLSRLALLSSCLLFGVGVALVGQIYNSHADSYGLFAVWFVPAVLFAALTRWQPFDVLAWLLALCAYMFYFFPSDGSFSYTELERIGILLGLAAWNAALYTLTALRRPNSPVVRCLAFITVHALLLQISISFMNEAYGWLFNFPLVALLAAGIWHFHRTRNKLYLLLSGIGVSVFAVVKYGELLFHYANEAFMLFSLLFVALFIAGNVLFLKYILRFAGGQDEAEGRPPVQEAVAEQEVDPREKGGERKASAERSVYFGWVARVLTAAAIAVGTVIGTASLIGLLVVVLNIDDPRNILVFLGIVVLAAMIAARHLNPVVRYTLATISLIVGSQSALLLDHASYSLPALLILLAMIAVGCWYNAGLLQRCYYCVAGELLLWQTVHELLPVRSAATRLAVTGLILGLLALSAAFKRMPESLRKPLLICVYPGWLLSFFALTFAVEGAAYYACNFAFLAVSTAALFISHVYRQRAIYTSSLILWIAFLVYKYYETVWKLLHKSFSLAALGLLIWLATAWLERRYARRAARGDGGDSAADGGVGGGAAAGVAAADGDSGAGGWTGAMDAMGAAGVNGAANAATGANSAAASAAGAAKHARRRLWAAAGLTALQLVFLAAQIAGSEWQLSHGQRIKLELAPLDPRSLLQGDYVQLRYDITEPAQLPESARAALDLKPRAALVLAPDSGGVWRFQRLYRTDEALAPGEVRINGRWTGYAGFRFGIETFFVPEGTGGDVQRDARFAEVNVSASGDALVVRLLKQ
ncbi:GDYXXLXY domain-containing protein [Paenibacillus athensensis]|uniref:DUF2157 domain-containing protein n=2 Tax=Paenibacillus athensensis TaxID=1967502 RepID=A0A4Y8PZ53_9BACL|nr:GDYXXLXY domain-containing protein [Paenibacillus athensensis]MCD1260435.1 GDYXXLXY domain-containing protein [Paenibacillus athensensis]